jgi:NAD(P)-dependent dehydrogenase (short-subunit alcohol dehydrogenase family)
MEARKDAVWLVTGCSTGLGRALAAEVLRAGYRCIATARDPAAVADIVAPHPATSRAVALDVTRPESIRAALREAESAFGGVDVLVNNAGYGYLATAEEGDDDEIRALFETNFFGLAALTRAVLPGMRAKGRGHVINVSSIGGLIGNSSSAYYNATKFAVEGFSEALAMEAGPLGVRVTIVEPGPFRTDWAGRSMHVARHPIAAYAETAHARREQVLRSSGRQAGDPARGARAIIGAFESPQPPMHLVLGRIALERAREKFTTMLADFDRWEAVSLGCDFA